MPALLGSRSSVVRWLLLVANGVCLVADGEFGRATWGALVAYGRQRSQPRC
jgi:hypothetical protein